MTDHELIESRLTAAETNRDFFVKIRTLDLRSLVEEVARLREERDEANQNAADWLNERWDRAGLEARIAELEENVRYTAEMWAKRCARLDGEYTRLLKAFAAYRSALRSGEPESPELTALGEEALSSRRVPGG